MAQLDPSIPGRRLAAVAAIVSLPFAYLTQTLFTLGSGGDTTAFFDAARLLSVNADHGALLYFGYWADILGYYLIFLPVLIYAWKAFRAVDESLTDLAFACGLVYCLLGAIGAATQAAALQDLRPIHALGTPADKAAAEAAWTATVAGQWRGLWILEASLAAIWFGGLAKLLLTTGNKGLGWLAALISALWALLFTAWLIGLHELSDLFLVIVVLVSPIWAAWLGIRLWSVPEPNEIP
ncbi:MAG: hypothetical protein AAF996_10150 [Pseudomonadota bacterium]